MCRSRQLFSYRKKQSVKSVFLSQGSLPKMCNWPICLQYFNSLENLVTNLSKFWSWPKVLTYGVVPSRWVHAVWTGWASQIQTLVLAGLFPSAASQPQLNFPSLWRRSVWAVFWPNVREFFSVYEIGYKAFPRIISHLDWWPRAKADKTGRF